MGRNNALAMTLATIPQSSVELVLNRNLTGSWMARARQLRGALCDALPGEDLFHQHEKDGALIYRYPLVQYRWLDGRAVLQGWRQASHRLLELPWPELEMRLGQEQVQVVDATLHVHKATFGVADRLIRYDLVTPILLFNQKTYHNYRLLRPEEQAAERDRLLVAQLLTALRSLEIVFPTQLYASFSSEQLVRCPFKNQILLGVVGGFVSNLELPAGFGFGKASSHGFGWVVRSAGRRRGRGDEDASPLTDPEAPGGAVSRSAGGADEVDLEDAAFLEDLLDPDEA